MENASVLDYTTPIHVIPSYASIDECAFYTIASVEESYNKIMESVGIYELSLVLEGKEGEEKEKFSIKNVLTKFVEFVKEAWRKFQDAVQTLKNRVEAFIASKVKALVDNSAFKIDNSKIVAAIREKGADVWAKKGKDGKASAEALDAFKVNYQLNSNDAYQLYNKLNSAITTIQGYVDKHIADGNFDEINANAVFADKLGFSEETFGDAAKLKAAILDEIVNTSGKMNAEQVYKYVLGEYSKFSNEISKAQTDFKDKIKKPYNETKKAFDKHIKEAHKTAKQAKDSKAFKPMFKSVSGVLKTSSCVVNAIEGAYLKEFAYKYHVILKGMQIYMSSKFAKKEKTNESVDMSSSTFQSELGSLFNF